MFETIVKQYVKITLDKPVITEFFSGTLFVRTITKEQAEAVLTALNAKVGKTQMSPIGDTGEFAYDFVA